MKQGYDVIITNRKQCDIKLNSYLIEAELMISDIPDVALFDPKTREWKEWYVEEEDTLAFNAGKNGKFIYYPKLLTPERTALLINFITAYSGNSLSITKSVVNV